MFCGLRYATAKQSTTNIPLLRALSVSSEMEEYPSILRIEKIRAAIVGSLFILILIVPMIIGTAFQSIQIYLLSFLSSGVIAYVLFRKYYQKLENCCPKCTDGVLAENYNDSPRGSFNNVKHTCKHCGAKFKDGIYINT